MSLVIEARMLLKIKAVRRDLSKFSGPTRFPIILNQNKLSDCGCDRGEKEFFFATFKAGMLLKTNEA
jgi:hypothetical protein